MAGGSRFGQASETRYLRIGAGPARARSFQAATALAGVISAPLGIRGCDRDRICGVPGLIGVAVTTEGPLDNVRLMAAGHLDTGLCQARLAADALHDAVRTGTDMPLVIAPLYPEVVHLVVRAESPVCGVNDLRGRRVSLGSASCGDPHLARAILAQAGLSERDLRVSRLAMPDAAERLAANAIDAFLCVEGVPSPVIQELARTTKIRLLAIVGSDSSSAAMGYADAMIPDGAYPGVDDTPSFAVPALWLARAGLDAALVYALAHALWRPENRSALAGIAPAARLAAVGGVLGGLKLPVHPGADRFYRDFGVPN